MIVERSHPVWRTPGIGAEDASVILELTRFGSRADLRKRIAMRLVEIEQAGPAWHEWRASGVGASESASVLGLSPYKSREELLEEKVTGESSFGENANTRRGKHYEPEARSAYEQVYGWKMRPVCAVHDEYPFVKASLDGIRDDGQLILEIKCPTSQNYERVVSGSLPDYWQSQVQHQLLVTGATTCHFLVYRPKGRADRARWKVISVVADPEFQAILLQELRDFWNEVETEKALRRTD